MQSSGQKSPRLTYRVEWFLVLLAGCTHWLIALGSVRTKSNTFDEPAHIIRGVSIWHTGDFRFLQETPPLIHLWDSWPLRFFQLAVPSFNGPEWQKSDHWHFGRQFLFELGNNADRILNLTRSMSAIFGVALCCLVWRVSKSFFGAIGAQITLWLCALSPDLLAHSPLVTADAAAAFFFLASVVAVWRFMQLLSLARFTLAVISLSGLLLSKMSGPLIAPMIALLVLVRILDGRPLPLQFGIRRIVRGRLSMLAVLVGAGILINVCVLVMMWGAYGFRYQATVHATTPNDRFYIPTDPRPPDPWEYVLTEGGAVRELIRFARDRRLMPESYLFGLAYTLKHAQRRQTFIAGECGDQGRLSYFPLSFLIKTPLPLLIMSFIALMLLLRRPLATMELVGPFGMWHRPKMWDLLSSRSQQPISPPPADSSPSPEEENPTQLRRRLYDLSPILILFTVYWLTAITSNLNIGHRHLLPTYPCLFILCGSLGVWMSPLKKFRTAIAAFLLGAYGVGTALAWPHYLAYFNSIVGGSKNGYRYFVDSSLDWGQDLPALKKWIDNQPADILRSSREIGQGEGDGSRPQKPPIYLSYFGTAYPTWYGIQAYMLPSMMPWPDARLAPLRPGVYMISATMLQQTPIVEECNWTRALEEDYHRLHRAFRYRPGFDYGILPPDPQDIDYRIVNLTFARLFAYLRTRHPDDTAGHSILIFRLTEDDLRRAFEEPFHE